MAWQQLERLTLGAGLVLDSRLPALSRTWNSGSDYGGSQSLFANEVVPQSCRIARDPGHGPCGGSICYANPHIKHRPFKTSRCPHRGPIEGNNQWGVPWGRCHCRQPFTFHEKPTVRGLQLGVKVLAQHRRKMSPKGMPVSLRFPGVFFQD